MRQRKTSPFGPPIKVDLYQQEAGSVIIIVGLIELRAITGKNLEVKLGPFERSYKKIQL